MRNFRKKYQVEQAVILCGGFGTRLSKITIKTPKPLIKFNKIIFLDYIIKNLLRYGFKEIVLLCHYKSEHFIKRYHNKEIFPGITIKCVVEKKALGTFGSIKNAKKELKDFFLLLNGDTYFDINYRDMIISYNYKKFLGIIALAKKNGNQFSKILLNKKGVIKKFYNDKKNSVINSGVYIFSKKICKIESNEYSSLEKEILPKLVKQKNIQGKKYVKKHNKFIDIGTPKDYVKAEEFLSNAIRKKAVFIDRDGVLNEDLGYVHKIKDFIWKKDVIKAVKFLNDNNYYVFIVTNQGGVGLGYFKEAAIKNLHRWIVFKLNEKGAHIDGLFYSTYHPNSKKKFSNKEKNLRKPNTGMLEVAFNKWNILIKGSLVIGDNQTDIMMAQKADINSYLVKKKTNLLNVVKKFHKEKLL